MPGLLIGAIVLITVALCLYTINIFRVRHRSIVTKANLIGLTLAWLCDFTGTVFFYVLGQTQPLTVNPHSSLFVFHVWFGYLVLILMAAFIVWAFQTYRKRDHRPSHLLLNYALIAWLLWVVEYVTGMFVH